MEFCSSPTHPAILTGCGDLSLPSVCDLSPPLSHRTGFPDHARTDTSVSNAQDRESACPEDLHLLGLRGAADCLGSGTVRLLARVPVKRTMGKAEALKRQQMLSMGESFGMIYGRLDLAAQRRT